MNLKHKGTYVGIGIVAMLLGAFGLVAEDVAEGETTALDNAVLLAFRVPGHPEQPIGPHWLPEAVRDVTALGSYPILTIVVTLVVAYLLFVGRRATAALIAASVITGSIASMVLKAIFGRPRPELTGVAEVFTASFPSGHALTSAVTYLTIGAVLAGTTTSFRQRAFFIGSAALLTFLVGLTRLYLGVHFPTDVIAGWSLGAAWALGAFIVGSLLRSDAEAKHESPP